MLIKAQIKLEEPRTNVLVLALCFLAIQINACVSNKSPDSSKSLWLAVIHFEQVDNLIYIPVTVNGSKPFRFFLDGGSSACILDPQVIKALGLKTSGSGVIHGAGSGGIAVTYADSISFGLPGINLVVPKATVIDLSISIPGQKVDGLIGYDLFNKFVVEINYHTNTIRLYDPKTFHYSGNGSRIPITLVRKLVHISATVKVAGLTPKVHDYLVDTGSGDSIDDTLIAHSSAPKTDGTGGVGLGNTFTVKIGTVEWLRLGRYTLKKLEGTSGSQAIGNGLLHNYDVFFDYLHHQLILE